MQGRQEIDNNYERRIENRLKTEPKIIKDYMASISALTASSRLVYLGHVATFISFLKENEIILDDSYEDFVNIKKIDIDRYMNAIKYNPATGKEVSASNRNAKLSAINSFFDFLVDNDVISKNPCASIKKIKDNKEKTVTYLTKEEVEEVKNNILNTPRGGWNYCDPWRFRDYALFILGCTTGLRNSAIREINIEDLDLEKRKVIVTEKNNVTKNVFLSNETCEALTQWLTERQKIIEKKNANVNAVFISSQMKRMSATALQDILKKYACIDGKKITPHKMRSTCAMNLYGETKDIYLVAQQLGHKNVTNTQIYAKATEKQMRETADLMDKIYG